MVSPGERRQAQAEGLWRAAISYSQWSMGVSPEMNATGEKQTARQRHH